jgi:phosphoglycolate phosphatase-like HAD superfamily hydrolase
MPLKQIVLDFDGTFTDLAIESRPFVPAFRAAIADLLGRDIGPRWQEIEAKIRANPSNYGWTFQGKVVAPSLADPYLLGTAISQELIDEAGVLKIPTLRTAISQALYSHAYASTETGFKPSARACLEGLLATGVPCAIVTNSDTRVVQAKIDALAPSGRERLVVRGEARKFWITDPADGTWPVSVGETERSPELPRPIFLRRGKYLDVLRELTSDGISFDEVLVVGDIYELDLALPAALGCQIGLVVGAGTQPYEQERVRAHGGRLLADIAEAVPFAQDLLASLKGPVTGSRSGHR